MGWLGMIRRTTGYSRLTGPLASAPTRFTLRDGEAGCFGGGQPWQAGT